MTMNSIYVVYFANTAGMKFNSFADAKDAALHLSQLNADIDIDVTSGFTGEILYTAHNNICTYDPELTNQPEGLEIDFYTAYDLLRDNEILTDAELELVTAMDGSTLETLDKACYVRTGFHSVESWYECELKEW